jgi:uncharacterized protein (TIGR02145 family)
VTARCERVVMFANYLAAGVTGVDAANLNATNAAVDAVAAAGAGTVAEVQALVVVVMTAGGITYSTVTIGDQTWTAENMRHEPSVGTAFTYAGDSADMVVIFGKLYDWDTAMQNSTTDKAQGICAAGWHVPSDQDWKDLEDRLGMDDNVQNLEGYRGTDQGTQLKVGGTSGFEAQLAGDLNPSNGSISAGRGINAHMWSSTEGANATNAYRRDLKNNEGGVKRTNFLKTNNFSVRCLKD